jgi:hypothetical protein
MRCTLPSYRRAHGTDKKETGNKEGSHRSDEAEQEYFATATDHRTDLGDRNSWYCVPDEAGRIQLEQRMCTTAKVLLEVFGANPRSRIALEIRTPVCASSRSFFLRLSPIKRTLRAFATITSCHNSFNKRLIQHKTNGIPPKVFHSLICSPQPLLTIS